MGTGLGDKDLELNGLRFPAPSEPLDGVEYGCPWDSKMESQDCPAHDLRVQTLHSPPSGFRIAFYRSSVSFFRPLGCVSEHLDKEWLLLFHCRGRKHYAVSEVASGRFVALLIFRTEID